MFFVSFSITTFELRGIERDRERERDADSDCWRYERLLLLLRVRPLDGLRDRVRRVPLGFSSACDFEGEVDRASAGRGVLAGLGERPRDTLRSRAGDDPASMLARRYRSTSLLQRRAGEVGNL